MAAKGSRPRPTMQPSRTASSGSSVRTAGTPTGAGRTRRLADAAVAREFARGEHESAANGACGPGYDFGGIVHAELDIRNPAVYASQHDLDHEAYEAEFGAGNHPGNYLPDEEWAEDSWPVACEIQARWGISEIPANALDCGLGGAGPDPAPSTWAAAPPRNARTA